MARAAPGDSADDIMLGVKRVLVPINGSPASIAALRLAAEVAQLNKGSVYAIYIIEVARNLPLDAEIPAEIERSEAIFARARAALHGRGAMVEFELLQARNAGATIVDEAVNIGTEAIVMGIADKHRHGEFDLGQTANFVLRHAPCQVWLCRGPLRQT